LFRREIDNISDETLIKFFISEGMSERLAKSLVKLSKNVEKLKTNIFYLDEVDESEEKEDWGFIFFDVVRYPPNSNPPTMN